MVNCEIGVIGAGIIGLTTGLELQKTFPNASITLLAKGFDQETTSAVAAGLFLPTPSFSGPTEVITRRWIKDAYDSWEDLRLSSEAQRAGVQQQSGYLFSRLYPDNVKNLYVSNIVPVYRPATSDELKLCAGDWKYGTFITSIQIETGYFLPWALNKFKSNGGKVFREEVKNLNDVAGKYDVVVNCSGLNSKYLFSDPKSVPIRGQVIKVKAPWLKTFFFGDYDTYIIPGLESVTLGGCRHYNSYNMEVNNYDMLGIKERCEALLPRLKGAEVVAHRVGLRPHRDPVRVERKNYEVGGKVVKVVHNYGHGGYGVTTAPGTAVHAVKLVKETLMGNSKL